MENLKNKEDLVKEAFKNYTEDAENNEKIIIDLNNFDGDVSDENGELDLELESELNLMLIDMFNKNGYSTYKNAETYAYNGNWETVEPDVVVAIKQ